VRWTTSLAPLRLRNFKLYWIGQTFSSLGNGMYPVAIAFAVLALRGSASDLGIVLLVSYIPQIVLFLVGGVVADRVRRERVIALTSLAKGAVEVILAVLLLTEVAALWHFIVAGFIFGTVSSFGTPAITGLVPSIVPAEQVQQANALNSLSRNTVGLVGPAVAGVMVALVGAGWVIVIDAATFFVLVFAMALMRVPPREITRDEPEPSFVRELREGWREVISRTWVWTSIVYFGVFNLALAPSEVLGPFVADRSLGGAPAWGVISAAASAGSLLGGLTALWFKPKRPLFVAYLAVSAIGLESIMLARPYGVPAIAGAALLGFGTVDFGVTLWFTVLQQRIPDQVLSRVSSYDYLGSFVAVPLGYAISAPLASAFGLGPTLQVAGVVLIVSSIAAAFIPSIRKLERMEPPADEASIEQSTI